MNSSSNRINIYKKILQVMEKGLSEGTIAGVKVKLITRRQITNNLRLPDGYIFTLKDENIIKILRILCRRIKCKYVLIVRKAKESSPKPKYLFVKTLEEVDKLLEYYSHLYYIVIVIKCE